MQSPSNTVLQTEAALLQQKGETDSAILELVFSIPSETQQLKLKLMVIIAEWADKIIFIHYDVLKAVTQKILMHTINFFSKEAIHECKEGESKNYTLQRCYL